jgi:hypothetical protein
VQNELVVRVSKAGASILGADVRASFEMLAMDMGSQRVQLHERRAGVYSVTALPFAMPGDWGIRIEVAPRRGTPVTAQLVDRVGR